MNFDFSDDQRRLQDEVRRVLADHSTNVHVRRVLDGAAPFCADTWRELAALGALGIAIPEAHGGSGMGLLELCLVAEEAGRALVAAPLLPSIYLAAEAIRRAGSAVQQAAWLPRLAAGEAVIAAVLDERNHRVLKDPKLSLADGKVSGAVQAVPDGMAAEAALLLVDGRLVLVDLRGEGVERHALKSLDPTRPLARLVFDGAVAEALDAADGATVAAQVVNGAAVLLAFEQVGGAARALHAARDHALQRRAFGRAIGSFQGVKHKLAELFAQIEIARAHAYYGAWALATGAAELPRAAAAARVAATTAYNAAAEESLHLHGGIGYTWELDCHLHLRRARWLGQILGSEHAWREKLASALIEEAA
ncbi:MAG: acyl-CoA/acyl-ACP dehydrogenase [Sphingomonadales bacterium]|nr:acyl-CoA/acyl-ACP dehydrogenase [Sphingomonadales bacterium]